MTCLIDGDSIAYILAWIHREHQNVGEMEDSIDKFLDDIFTLTGADTYMGALACRDRCFRYDVYRVRPYKGNRPEKAPHVQFWQPIVLKRLEEKYHFINIPGQEADDIIARAVLTCMHASINEYVICSTDKDLRQLPGYHYNYSGDKQDTIFVDQSMANYNFWIQMLTGDDTDNVAGIPGFGPEKAKKKLSFTLETWAIPSEVYRLAVEAEYIKHFGGGYYGQIIFKETLDTLKLGHRLPDDISIALHPVPKRLTGTVFDELAF